MAKTVIGLFDNPRQAHQAVVELVDSGIPHADISTTSADTGSYNAGYAPEGRTTDTHENEGIGEKIKNFFSSLFGSDDEEDAKYYSNAVTRGGTVVTVDANNDDMAQRAATIMDRHGADIDERGMRSKDTARTDGAVARDREAADAGTTAKIPVIEESVDVGKREVERGGVRVRTRIIERPVEKDVRLREERVHVERHPVNRPVTADDIRAFREGTIEIRETVEEPVVRKQARVVEEVAINKEAGERTETIRDTVHKTDVNVEETGGAARAKTARASGSSQPDEPEKKRNS